MQQLALASAKTAYDTGGRSLLADPTKLTLSQAKANRTRELASSTQMHPWLSLENQSTSNLIFRVENYLEWNNREHPPRH